MGKVVQNQKILLNLIQKIIIFQVFTWWIITWLDIEELPLDSTQISSPPEQCEQDCKK